jgi:hypothetical protein
MQRSSDEYSSTYTSEDTLMIDDDSSENFDTALDRLAHTFDEGFRF